MYIFEYIKYPHPNNTYFTFTFISLRTTAVRRIRSSVGGGLLLCWRESSGE